MKAGTPDFRLAATPSSDPRLGSAAIIHKNEPPRADSKPVVFAGSDTYDLLGNLGVHGGYDGSSDGLTGPTTGKVIKTEVGGTILRADRHMNFSSFGPLSDG